MKDGSEDADAAVTGAEVVEAAAAEEDEAAAASASALGRTVVDTGTTLVTTAVDSAGQSVTVGAQLLIVKVRVEKMVDVVNSEPERVGAAMPVPLSYWRRPRCWWRPWNSALEAVAKAARRATESLPVSCISKKVLFLSVVLV